MVNDKDFGVNIKLSSLYHKKINSKYFEISFFQTGEEIFENRSFLYACMYVYIYS